MRSLRSMPYWNVQTTRGVDAHLMPAKMRRRRIRLFHAAAWSCGRRRPDTCTARGIGGGAGSDPPARGPGSGAGPVVFSHARPRLLGGRSLPNVLAGRLSNSAERGGSKNRRGHRIPQLSSVKTLGLALVEGQHVRDAEACGLVALNTPFGKGKIAKTARPHWTPGVRARAKHRPRLGQSRSEPPCCCATIPRQVGNTTDSEHDASQVRSVASRLRTELYP